MTEALMPKAKKRAVFYKKITKSVSNDEMDACLQWDSRWQTDPT